MTTQAPPTPSADATPAADTTTKGARPIPPAKEAAVAASTDTPRERGADGKFLPKDPKSDPAGALRDSLGATAEIAPIDDLSSSLYESEEDRDSDRPVATLDGMISEEKDKAPKIKMKTRDTIVQKALAKANGGADVAKKPDIVDEGAEDNVDTGDGKAAAAATDAASTTTPPPPVDPSAPAKTEKFVLATLIGDKVDEQFEFDTPAHAAQSFKTLRGMYRKEQNDRIALAANAEANFKAAQAWERKAKELEARANGTAPPSSTSPATTAPSSNAPTADMSVEDAVVSSINWDEYERVKGLAEAKYPSQPGTVDILMRAWTARETAKAMDAHVAKRFEKYEAPTRERAALVKHGEDVAAKMDDLETASLEDGSLAYPEFADNEARMEIGRLLRARAAKGLGWDFLKSDEGIYETVVVWRDWRRRTGRPWALGGNGNGHAPAPTPSPSTATTDAAGVESALRSLEGRNAGVMDGRRQPVRAAADSPAETIKRSILESDQRTPLGWSR